jgi:ring-1,2-phenylacetyl-CoA epoxidase subunit PaaE
MASPRFHSLTIANVQAQTQDAVSIAFTVPDALRDAYRFTQGQFLTLKALINGQEQRRSYSVCVGTRRYQEQGELRVAIKRVAGGLFSNWANENLVAGQSIEVMTPDGRFNIGIEPTKARHYLGIAGGSGITPMLSIIETMLEAEPQSHFSLVYGNRNVRSIMFLEELDHLKSRFLARFQLIHVLSEETLENELFSGVLDQARCTRIIEGLGLSTGLDHAFICGPEPMMNAAEASLKALGVAPSAIAIERFGTALPSGAARAKPSVAANDGPTAQLHLISDGVTRVMPIAMQGQSVLDAGLAAGANLPYACKGGVCCTCRAKVLEGRVHMEKNFTLENWEIEKGFVLTCQSHPLTDKVVISFDER